MSRLALAALIKNARQFWMGVFFICLLTACEEAGPFDEVADLAVEADVPAAEACSAESPLQWARIKKVVDGDTLRLKDGRKLRVLAVNTPELNGSSGRAEPLAVKAKRAAEEFFAGQSELGWHYDKFSTGKGKGGGRQDHYGRELVHVFRRDGQSLAGYLISQGLAWRVALPPNFQYQPCLQGLEKSVQISGVGVWGEAAYQPLSSSDIAADDTGFQLVTGPVKRVTETRYEWWLTLPGLSLKLDKAAGLWRGREHPEQWLNKRILVRGWVVDRRGSKAASRGHPPFMMRVSHPSMLQLSQ